MWYYEVHFIWNQRHGTTAVVHRGCKFTEIGRLIILHQLFHDFYLVNKCMSMYVCIVMSAYNTTTIDLYIII